MKYTDKKKSSIKEFDYNNFQNIIRSYNQILFYIDELGIYRDPLYNCSEFHKFMSFISFKLSEIIRTYYVENDKKNPFNDPIKPFKLYSYSKRHDICPSFGRRSHRKRKGSHKKRKGSHKRKTRRGSHKRKTRRGSHKRSKK